MKKCITFLILFTTSIAAWTQNTEVYRVISISGSIEHVKLNRPLQQGDRISLNDPLKFSDKSNFVIVIHPKIGRKMIRGVPDSSPRELENLIQSFVKPSERSTASRSTTTEYWSQLNEALKDTVVILGDGVVTLKSEFIKLAPPAVVVAVNKVKKGSPISRKISSQQEVLLSRATLFPDAGNEVSSKVMIEYYADEKVSLDLPGSGQLIGYFWPKYVDEVKLEKECRVIADFFAEYKNPAVVKEIKSFIEEHYGNVESSNLNRWLNQRQIIQ
jgi:hypothetical protein